LAALVEQGRLRLIVRRWALFDVALPLFFAPRGDAFEFEESGRFHFDVTIGAPWIGAIVRYRGWLAPR
jgi:Domain of unknown function (DUF4166)